MSEEKPEHAQCCFCGSQHGLRWFDLTAYCKRKQSLTIVGDVPFKKNVRVRLPVCEQCDVVAVHSPAFGKVVISLAPEQG